MTYASLPAQSVAEACRLAERSLSEERQGILEAKLDSQLDEAALDKLDERREKTRHLQRLAEAIGEKEMAIALADFALIDTWYRAPMTREPLVHEALAYSIALLQALPQECQKPHLCREMSELFIRLVPDGKMREAISFAASEVLDDVLSAGRVQAGTKEFHWPMSVAEANRALMERLQADTKGTSAQGREISPGEEQEESARRLLAFIQGGSREEG